MARTIPGSGAVIEPIFNDIFGVKAVKVLEGGSGYESADPPRLTVTGCGTPVEEALLYPIIDDVSGKIVHVRVLNSGRGYDPLRLSIIPEQDTPNVVTSFDIRRIWQSNPNSQTVGSFATDTDRFTITSDNHPKPADYLNERNPGGGPLEDQTFNQTFIYRGGKDVPHFGDRPTERNKPLAIMSNGVLLHTPDWAVADDTPVGFNVDTVRYDYIKNSDVFDGIIDNNQYYYSSNKLINHFKERNGVFENGLLRQFTWRIKSEFDNVLIVVNNIVEQLGEIELGRIVEKVGGTFARGEIAKIVEDEDGNPSRIYLRLVQGTFANGDNLLGSTGFTMTVAEDPITFPNGIFYIDFGPDAEEFGNFIPGQFYLSPQNVRVQRNYQIIWDQSDSTNQPSDVHTNGHPMQFSTTPDGPLNQTPGTLYYNSTGASAAPSADYENEFRPTFIMNGDETNRIYYFCRYHRHMSGYVGDEGYMVLDPAVENEPLPNNYYISDYYLDGSTIDYSRHVTGHSRILGLSFDGYPIYGPFGYDDSGNAIRMTSSYRFKVGDEVDGARPRITTTGTVNYTVTSVNNEFLIDGSVPSFLNLDRGKTYIFNLDDSSNLNLPLLLSTTEDGWHSTGLSSDIGVESFVYSDAVEYVIDGVVTTYSSYIANFNSAITREVRFTPRANSPRLLYVFGYPIASVGFRCVQDGYLIGDLVQDYIYDPNVGAGVLDAEYNNGPIINVVGDGSDFFKREVTTNGVRIMGAGTVGGQTAVPDAWLEKVARMVELFTDPNGAGINETFQRELIKTLSGDTGTYHAGLPTIQRVARGSGAEYTPNFLTDQGIIDWNLTDLFDSTVQNDMVWYLNSSGVGYGDGDIDAQEVIEHVFHTLHMHGLPADTIKLYEFLTPDWQSGPLYAAMEEAYDAGKWDPSGYEPSPGAFKTNAEAFEVAAKEYLYLLNFCMFEYTSLWEGGSLAPEWTDDMRTQAGIQANNPLGYAFHNTYIAPVISKPSLTTIRSIFQDGNTPQQDNPALAGASGYVVDVVAASAGSLDRHNGKFAVTPEYPNGTYAYFMTTDSNDNPVYPYVIGPEFYGTPQHPGSTVPALQDTFPSGAAGEVVLNPNGSVGYVKMTRNGDGYFGPAQAKILGGGGTGALGSPVVQTVTSLSLLQEGRSFATPPTLIFEGGGGGGARGRATINTAGKVTSIQVNDPGEFYQEPPYILITGGGGIGAKAVATVDQGVVTSITVTDPGNDYVNPPNIIFTKLVNLKRKVRTRQAFNSTPNYITGLLKDIGASDTEIYVDSTDAFPGSGSLIIGNETVSYTSKSRERFQNVTRGRNFRYDQRVILDTSQNDGDGNSTYQYNVGDRVIRRIESQNNKIAKVYDWDPSARALLVTFEVDELAFIDGGIPSTEDAIVQFDAGVAASAPSGFNPHVLIEVLGQNIVTLTEPIGLLTDRVFEDDDELDGAGDGIPDLVNTGTDFENQISLDGGIYNSLYGIEETVGGQNTTLFQVGEQIKDASLPFRYATILEAGGLSEGVPHEADMQIYIDPNDNNGQNYFPEEVVTGEISGVRATVTSWNNTQGILTVRDVVPFNTGNLSVGINGVLYKFSDTGTIIDFIVQNPGNDYSATPSITVENAGDIQSTATAVMTTAGDQIASVTVNNGGYGYSQYVDGTYNTRPTITVDNDPGDSTGNGAIIQAILGGEVLIGNNGARYRIKRVEFSTQLRSQ